MKNRNLILLKNLLLSTSQWNCIRHCKDKKRRGRAIGNFVAMGILFLLLMAYCVSMCIGYGVIGIAKTIPTICVLTISAINLFITFLKTNGYLFHFKEYDMLMALPFEVKWVAGTKFLYMYIKNLFWTAGISISMMVGYGIYAKPNPLVYPVWVILSLFVPIIPMLVASLIGFLIIKISSHFQKNNIIQTVISLVIVVFAFSLRFIIEGIAKSGEVELVLTDVADALEESMAFYLPAKWFAGAVTDLRIADMLLLVGVTILAFEIFFVFVGKSYRKINSALNSHGGARVFKMGQQKRKSIVKTICYKEWKRLLGSSVYMTNIFIGELLALILGVVTLIFGLDTIIATITQGAPLTIQMICPAIPLIIYFCVGMMTTTCVSPSLEGKNYWIIQSLPIDKRVLYQGKILFQLYLAIPFMVFGVVAFCISARVPVLISALYVIEGIVLCVFSACWGMVCGLKYRRLDWENEVEVVKQGAATAVYMLPNMIITIGLVVLVVFLGLQMDQILVTLVLIAIAAVLAILSYYKAMSMAKKSF